MMKTDEVVEKLRKLIPISNPKNQTELENPNYAIYALAPFWLPHQAICLLAQLKTIDEDTFRTCLSLKPLQMSINFAFYGKDELAKEITKKAQPSGKIGFGDFIMHHFPIPHSKITFLKNLYEKLSEAIKNGSLASKSEFQNQSLKTLLSPNDVVLWAQKEKIIIPSGLLEGLSSREQINMLYLPQTFKDEINVYNEWSSLCIKHKLSNPFSPLFKKPAHADESFAEGKTENQQENPRPSIEPSTSLALTARAKEIYNNTLRVRKLAIESYLKKKFDGEAIDYNNLIEKLGLVEEEEFKIYNKAGPWPKITEHCCRAIASVIRHFNNEILISDLEKDSFMIEHGKKSKKITPLTFRKWMHAEGIHDRPSLQKKV